MSVSRGERSGKKLKVGIVVSRFNEEVTSKLLGALSALESCGVALKNTFVVSVPGAFEIPGAAKRLIETKSVDAVVCLGAVIRGETEHFHYVSSAAEQGVLKVSLDSGVPCAFGVLTTNSVDQAMERAGGIYVHPDHWGRGAGKGLQDRAMDFLKERGFEQATLRNSRRPPLHSDR